MPRNKRDPEAQKKFTDALNGLIALNHIKDDPTLSRSVGIDSSQIWRYRKGLAMPDVQAAMTIAEFFSITVEELMGRSAPRKRPDDKSTFTEVGERVRQIEDRLSRLDNRMIDQAAAINGRLSNMAEAILALYKAIQGMASSAKDGGVVRSIGQKLSKLGIMREGHDN